MPKRKVVYAKQAMKPEAAMILWIEALLYDAKLENFGAHIQPQMFFDQYDMSKLLYRTFEHRLCFNISQC